MSKELTDSAVALLQGLIEKPSFSKEEEATAQLIIDWFNEQEVAYKRTNHNIWAKNKYFDSSKPTVLLNSHHDTVKPNKGYTKDPFKPEISNGKLFGLGSNDAGASLVSLMAVFNSFYRHRNLKYNLIFVASAEEEISGRNGLHAVLPLLPEIDFALIGEPTSMQMAIAEKGLLVLDCIAQGEAGHAAHELGLNAIYQACEAINWFKKYRFEKSSESLGEVKMTVTQINAGSQHNVVPGKCHFVVDIRVTDAYSNQEVLEIVKEQAGVEVKERSLRLNSSSISKDHPLVKAGKALGMTTYGSATLSDQAALNCPSLKLGPGDTLRSHSTDEFVFLDEIRDGINLYKELLKQVIL